ncbi:uncharacterized protein LOC133915038 isoform X2 [Phragmites australis]|uniref:uncharacterized protein LOC133915038 isoform X2 n=1 Tax=Phragmites australis TaxID=29695 RepID=UPI002D765DE8|nr:uncharacterized protein LOC133915038 isoform X2 [Phragmites australis]
MLEEPPPPPAVAGEEERTCHGVFLEFMTKVARFEELAESGKRLLVRFHQELENFRRPQIPAGSDVMSAILKSNCTGRMRSYLEAGCRLHCQNISNINQLRSCEDGLKDHINEVKTLLEELECLVKDVHGVTQTASLSALETLDNPSIDNKLNNETCFMEEDKSADQLETSDSPSIGNKLNNETCFMEEEDKSADQLDRDVSFVTVMIIVCNMLKLDYMMQEKIVSALSLKTPSSQLEGYCLMWDLRPYIDDNVMNLAWKMCP